MRVAVFLSALLCATFARAEVISFALDTKTTDPAIQTYTDPHWIYIDRDIVIKHQTELPADRHQLLLFLDGTGGRGRGPQAFLKLAAGLGYHVLNLQYSNDVPATACDYDRDNNEFERFRLAILMGGSASVMRDRQTFSVAPTESVQNRLIKALQRLQELRPRENWAQFLNQDGSIRWESIAVAGQSQGGGHAALLGLKFPLARVLCFGSPKDYSIRNNAPAAWYSDASATPKNRFYAFNHHQDPKGCTPDQLLSNLAALGLDAFGPIAEVDSEPFPYHHGHVLYTSYPTVTVTGEESEGAKIAHSAALTGLNAERWKQVWTYMLTDASQ